MTIKVTDTTTAGEVWADMFHRVLGWYKRRWWRWYLDASWRDLAWTDAMHQADMSSKQFVRWRTGR